jgi:hypothetical protein
MQVAGNFYRRLKCNLFGAEACVAIDFAADHYFSCPYFQWPTGVGFLILVNIRPNEKPVSPRELTGLAKTLTKRLSALSV